MKATTKEMRFSPKRLLDAASRGEEVVITYRGKPCAKMVPLEKRKEKKKTLKNIRFSGYGESTKNRRMSTRMLET